MSYLIYNFWRSLREQKKSPYQLMWLLKRSQHILWTFLVSRIVIIHLRREGISVKFCGNIRKCKGVCVMGGGGLGGGWVRQEGGKGRVKQCGKWRTFWPLLPSLVCYPCHTSLLNFFTSPMLSSILPIQYWGKKLVREISDMSSWKKM